MEKKNSRVHLIIIYLLLWLVILCNYVVIFFGWYAFMLNIIPEEMRSVFLGGQILIVGVLIMLHSSSKDLKKEIRISRKKE